MSSPQEIEREIERTRAHLDTIDAIGNKLSPMQMIGQILSFTKAGGGQFAGATLSDGSVMAVSPPEIPTHSTNFPPSAPRHSSRLAPIRTPRSLRRLETWLGFGAHNRRDRQPVALGRASGASARVQAAEYVGISPTKFDELVADGAMPKPKRIGSRTVWDRLRLEHAFEALPGEDRRLVINEAEAETVRGIFRAYLRLGNVRLL